MQGGRLSKARRGELNFCPPAGYEWDHSSLRFRFDPDESVQRAIGLIFERFRLECSAYVVTRYFGRMGLLLPVREFPTRQLKWVAARYTLVLSILHNPIYAGAYVFGRTEQRMGLVNGKLKRRCFRRMPQEEWKSVIHDRHPAYINWEEFMANQKKINENRTSRLGGYHRGAAREGHGLLQGLVLCGCCGRRMNMHYQGTNHRIQYQCRPNHVELGPVCFDVAGDKIDRAVEKQFLAAVVPADIDLALSLLRATEEQVQEIDIQWKLKMERLQYEARLAERRYKAIDPENRVVARTLEREWEEKLREQGKAEQERQTVLKKEKVNLTETDRTQLLRLAKDLQTVWRAETTTNAERKNLIRMLINEITLSPVEIPQRMTRVKIWWQTGAVSEILVARESRYTAQATPKETVETICALFKQGWSDSQIVAELNSKKIQRNINQPWDISAVRRVRYSYGFYRPSPKGHQAAIRREDGLYSVHGVAQLMAVTQANVRSWVAIKALVPVDGGGGPGRPCWFQLDETTLKRLNELKSKRISKHSPKEANF